jgi:hypothetical protein
MLINLTKLSAPTDANSVEITVFTVVPEVILTAKHAGLARRGYDFRWKIPHEQHENSQNWFILLSTLHF